MPEILTKQNKHNSPPMKSDGIVITYELIEDFIGYLLKSKHTIETVKTYRRHLNRIYSYLPEDRIVQRGTLDGLWEQMAEEGISIGTINITISVANSLFEYCDRRDLKIAKLTQDGISTMPTMTRREYQNLLLAARKKGDERTYLLIKFFGCMGIGVLKLHELTAEAVHAGRITIEDENGKKEERPLPSFLCRELENYMERQNIVSGPVFVSQNGNPLARVTVSLLIASLSEDAHVPREKCNPRCLQKLCQDARKNVEKNIMLQLERMYEYQLEQEQEIVGWTEGAGE